MRYLLAIAFILSTLFLSSGSLHAATNTVQTEIDASKQGLKGASAIFRPTAIRAGFPEGALEPEIVVGQIIRSLIVIIGVIFGVLVVYAGYLWMTARGNETQVKKARDILEHATIGVVIVFAAYALTSFVIDRVIGAAYQTGTNNTGPTNQETQFYDPGPRDE